MTNEHPKKRPETKAEAERKLKAAHVEGARLTKQLLRNMTKAVRLYNEIAVELGVATLELRVKKPSKRREIQR